MAYLFNYINQTVTISHPSESSDRSMCRQLRGVE